MSSPRVGNPRVGVSASCPVTAENTGRKNEAKNRHLGIIAQLCRAVSRPGSVAARHSSSGRHPNFAALKRVRHLYSAGRPSHWALAHIYSCQYSSLSYVPPQIFRRLWAGSIKQQVASCHTAEAISIQNLPAYPMPQRNNRCHRRVARPPQCLVWTSTPSHRLTILF